VRVAPTRASLVSSRDVRILRAHQGICSSYHCAGWSAQTIECLGVALAVGFFVSEYSVTLDAELTYNFVWVLCAESSRDLLRCELLTCFQ